VHRRRMVPAPSVPRDDRLADATKRSGGSGCDAGPSLQPLGREHCHFGAELCLDELLRLPRVGGLDLRDADLALKAEPHLVGVQDPRLPRFVSRDALRGQHGAGHSEQQQEKQQAHRTFQVSYVPRPAHNPRIVSPCRTSVRCSRAATRRGARRDGRRVSRV